MGLRGFFFSFFTSFFFLVISQLIEGILIFLLWITIFLFKITVGTCLVRVVPFRQRVRRLMVVKPIILSCHWKCYRVLFYLAWRVIVNDRRFVIDGHLFPFIYFSP